MNDPAFMELAQQLAPLVTVLAIGITEVIKRATNMPGRYVALTATAVGAVAGTLVALYFGYSLLGGLLFGLITGLSSVGLHATASHLIGGSEAPTDVPTGASGP